ncbi:MAG: cystathionine beta-synthase [Deltaproteobacteria bacterium]|nr:cystathionine beta-synthase [Deltaproteobacteria bacterium]
MMQGAVSNVLDAVGNTPIVKLNRVAAGLAADIYVKLEYLNPAGSMKDRIAINIVDDVERTGLLKPGGTIVEATSGNTGAGLAMVAAVRGYKSIFVMPDKMSQEKIAALRAWGSKVVVCPTAVEPEDPRSYYSVARRLAEETPNAVLANQYHNPANPEAHYKTTGPEIYEQTKGEIHAFVAGMGTGGTLSGTGKYFKERNPDIRIVGVDPVGSVYYDRFRYGRDTRAFTYKVEGIGEDFYPSTMNLKILDEVVRVDDRECFLMTRDLVRLEGIYCGGSCGAAVAGAIKYARARNKKENIVVLLADSAGRYLSKIFNDDWMRENGFLGTEGTVRELLDMKGLRPMVVARPNDSVRHVIQTMKAHGISQLPVVGDDDRIYGLVAEVDVLRHLVSGEGHLDGNIEHIVESDYASVTPDTRIDLLQGVLADAKIALVTEEHKLVGLLTKIDLIDYLSRKTVAG